MSSKKVSLLSISLKQYFYKLKAHSNLVQSLIIVQLIALFFASVGVTGSSSTSSGGLSVSVRNYSSSTMIVFALFWIWFVTLRVNKAYPKIELPLVTNRLSENLSNVSFLITACVFGGITSSLISLMPRMITYFTVNRAQIDLYGFYLGFGDILLGMFVGILYMLLISAISYLIGVLSHFNSAFTIIIPAVILGVLRVYTNFALSVFKFYVFEASLAMFVLKIIITVVFLFGVSIFFSNKMEVSQ